jgi:tripartite-type tricarboxylate transporter receptor subunit TctC
MSKNMRTILSAGIFTGLCVFGVNTMSAADATEFYKGKTVKIYVGAGAGGGYGFFGRAFGKFYGNHIPGKPNVIVINKPGAGGTKMTNWAYNVAPKDGSVVGMPLMTVATNQHLRAKKIKYDATKLNWIGNMERSISLLFTWHTSKTKTMADARKRVTMMGGSGKSSPIYQNIILANRLLGTKFKVVLGYKGADRALAIEKEEVEGSFSTLQNFRAMTPHWFKDGKNPLNILVQNANERNKELPNVPTTIELAKNEADKEVFRYMMLQSLTGRSVFAPPGVPSKRVNILRRAFDKTMKDKGFVAFIERANLKLTTNTGEEVTKAVNKLISTPPAVVKRIKKLIK